LVGLLAIKKGLLCAWKSLYAQGTFCNKQDADFLLSFVLGAAKIIFAIGLLPQLNPVFGVEIRET
jgi:hypothetical protein